MKLHRVQLSNIRQFAGHQSVDFSIEAERKITLIHGPNTGGKTTLLNAIYWCLYGKFLRGFDEPDRLLCNESDEATFLVEVQFEHQQHRYVARRSGRSTPAEAKLTVLEQRPTGQSVPHPQPELLIASILPEALAPFFFFAGEMIQKGLSSGTYQAGATDAIRAVLGLKLAEQALDDLRDIRKKKRKELLTLSAGTDLAEVTSKLTEAEQYVDTRTSQLSSVKTLITQFESQKRDLFATLRDTESSAQLQRRRDRNIAALGQEKNSLKKALAARQEFVFQYGAAAFLAAPAAATTVFIDSAVTQKRIPSPFDRTFVQDILSSQKCVCDRPIAPGTAEYRAVSSLINSATDEHTIRRALSVRGTADKVQTLQKGASRILRSTLEQFDAAQERIASLEQEEARLKDLFDRHEANNVRALEAQLDNVERQLRDFIGNKQRTEDEVEAKRRELEALKVDFDRAKAASPQVSQVRKGVDLIDSLIATLEKELAAVEQDGIKRISALLNDVVQNSTRQKYSAQVTADYVIELETLDGGGQRKRVQVLSSGERRLLDLCFVAALVSVCRERENDANAVLVPGAVAPMIVDAPFGELDPEYQALAASTMMNLSEQLVLMLSKTHWTPAVDGAIRGAVGREYLLVGHRTEEARHASPVEIAIGDRTFQQMVFGSPKSFTEIRDITN